MTCGLSDVYEDVKTIHVHSAFDGGVKKRNNLINK